MWCLRQNHETFRLWHVAYFARALDKRGAIVNISSQNHFSKAKEKVILARSWITQSASSQRLNVVGSTYDQCDLMVEIMQSASSQRFDVVGSTYDQCHLTVEMERSSHVQLHACEKEKKKASQGAKGKAKERGTKLSNPMWAGGMCLIYFSLWGLPCVNQERR